MVIIKPIVYESLGKEINCAKGERIAPSAPYL